MLRRRRATISAGAALLMAILAATVNGCGAAPESSEPAATFATDDEAFAAAEKTYRAYIDALNQVDLADPSTFEPVFALLDGAAEAGLRKEFSQMHADEWSVSGQSKATVVEAVSIEEGEAALAVCLDVREVSLTDPSGGSTVDPGRLDQQVMLVRVKVSPDGRSRITSLESREGEPACE